MALHDDRHPVSPRTSAHLEPQRIRLLHASTTPPLPSLARLCQPLPVMSHVTCDELHQLCEGSIVTSRVNCDGSRPSRRVLNCGESSIVASRVIDALMGGQSRPSVTSPLPLSPLPLSPLPTSPLPPSPLPPNPLPLSPLPLSPLPPSPLPLSGSGPRSEAYLQSHARAQ
jgi:hypothetical protein